jgi:hypothetical protein
MSATVILITIICFLTPCFGIAQEPEGIFSIEGTIWRVQFSAVHLTPYPPYVETFGIVALLGFSDGRMFSCMPEEGDTCTPDYEFPNSPPNSYYIDCPVLSLAYVGGCIGTTESGEVSCVSYVHLMQPIVGVGSATVFSRNSPPGSNNIGIGSGFMVKESDDWSP